jgi:hypothetical protein
MRLGFEPRRPLRARLFSGPVPAPTSTLAEQALLAKSPVAGTYAHAERACATGRSGTGR